MSKVEQADLRGAQVLGWVLLWSRQGSGEASGMVALQQKRRRNPVYHGIGSVSTAGKAARS